MNTCLTYLTTFLPPKKKHYEDVSIIGLLPVTKALRILGRIIEVMKKVNTEPNPLSTSSPSDGDTESGGFDNPYGDTPDDFDSENAVTQPGGDPSADSEQNNGGGTNNDGDTAPNGAPRGTPASDHPADLAGPPPSTSGGGNNGDGTAPNGAPRGTPASDHPADLAGPPPSTSGGGNGGSSSGGGPPGDGTDGNGGGPGSGPGGAPGGTGGGGNGGGNGGGSGGGNGGGNSGGRPGEGPGGGWGRPIVLDLDGDGVELVALDESVAFYDINGNGYQYNLGWAGADDGLLVYDKGNDGIINRKDELSFVDYVAGARTDLEGLRYFDSNGDGVLDASDAEFAKFKVWQDADQDGEVDAGELRTLSEAGIRSLSLAYQAGDDGVAEEREGNIIFGEELYQKTDGTAGVFADAAFAVSGVGFREDGDNLEFKIADVEGKIYVAPEDSTAGLNMDFAATDNTEHIGALGGAHADVLNGEGVTRDLLLLGGAGADTLTGGDGNDWLVVSGFSTCETNQAACMSC